MKALTVKHLELFKGKLIALKDELKSNTDLFVGGRNSEICCHEASLYVNSYFWAKGEFESYLPEGQEEKGAKFKEFFIENKKKTEALDVAIVEAKRQIELSESVDFALSLI